MRKKVKINFAGFFETEPFIELLQKRYDVEISSQPDYLFYSVFDDSYIKYGPDCVRIFVSYECADPDFRQCDYATGYFNINFYDRSLYSSLEWFPPYSERFDLALKKHLDPEDALHRKTDFCSYVYRHSNTDGRRDHVLRLLESYKHVNCGGAAYNTYGGRCVEDKLKFQLGHKFVIAGDKVSHNDYHTEKLFDAFAARAIPIYCGGKTIKDLVNPNAFVNVDDYLSDEALLQRVRELDEDDGKYLEMLAQPVFTGPVPDAFRKEPLEEFLFHIFDQEKEQAFRRNRLFWGSINEPKIRRYYIADKVWQKTLGRPYAKIQQIRRRRQVEKRDRDWIEQAKL